MEVEESYNPVMNTNESEKESREVERRLVKAISEDDKWNLGSLCRMLEIERERVSKLFQLSCEMDSIECARSLVGGEMGVVAVVNEMDEEGVAPIHVAAKANAARVLHLLLNKRARTDLKTRDPHKLLPLQIALCSITKEMKWNMEENSVEELMYELREKDLTVVKLLGDKTKEIVEVAHESAMAGRIADLGALLMVAAEKVIGSEIDLHDTEVDCKQRATVYECVIREALALGHGAKSSKLAKGKSPTNESNSDEKRKLMLCEIELLQLFGAVSLTDHSNSSKKLLLPLIRASQVGDRDVIELLLRTSVDINDVDAEGNSALHWCLKTSKGSCPEQIKNMCLLLKHDARVGQKNKLGLTAVHIAAANGNSQALQLLLLKDPDCVNSKSEMKETPLFSAVKNNHKECAGILLRLGANTEVLNLRANVIFYPTCVILSRQRPIDLAESEDMRLMLRPTNISLTNHTCPIKHTFWLQGDEVISESCEEIVSTNSKGNATNSGKTPICKYFDSPKGCVRGSKCFYTHVEEELRPKGRKDMLYSSFALSEDLKRKIFVGGLPPSLDSDSLSKTFEEQFGSVEDAMVVGAPTGEKVVSRGFGFVIFKEEKSVSAAVAARYVTIMGKQVEIRSAIPKSLLLAYLQLSNQDELLAGFSKKKIISRTIVCGDEKPGSNVQSLQAPIEKVGRGFSHDKKNAEVKSELISWVHRLIRGQPKDSVAGLKMDEKKRPLWLKTFEKWLPRFIRYVSKKEGEYALSSLKADFRGAFGLELDHASLGFPKLSDFMKCYPDICEIKFVPLGKQKSANHTVLVPAIPKRLRKPLQPLSVNNLSQAELTDDSADDDCKEIESVQETLLLSNENENLSGNNLQVHQEIPEDNLDDVSSNETSGFLQFLKPDQIFHARPWLYGDCDAGTKVKSDQQDGLQKVKTRSPQRHAVLEALAKKNNNSSVFLLREFDFYDNYSACVKQGKCFGCKRPQVLWANYPCMHLLWCSDCKLQATRASGNLEHKCVVCDTTVEKIYLTSFHEYCQAVGRTSPIDEFPPFDPDYLRNLSKN